ncbi:hypothetical protein [Pseudomonas fontis]|uniref:HEAT repeat domain-containing protein n=1 Tax=Pseudomonas fontis TaxID=2942633 RepID=A0ABT5NXX3_9PSED|nr:hypothetical protein [Pseudomonas fontis]MDD0973825.1 hypothetical protein [Pseudomonas fontis]MDD0992959.1 hypothetical protein [Pseudomonas fontis]
MKLMFIVLLSLFSLSANAQTIAEKLTILSLDKDVDEDSKEVKRTQAALTRGLTVCNFENEEKLASAAWVITKNIREKGQYAEATDIVEGVNAALLGAKAKQDCSEVMALYAVNRIEGSTHSDAVTGARGLYRTMGLVK